MCARKGISQSIASSNASPPRLPHSETHASSLRLPHSEPLGFAQVQAVTDAHITERLREASGGLQRLANPATASPTIAFQQQLSDTIHRDSAQSLEQGRSDFS